MSSHELRKFAVPVFAVAASGLASLGATPHTEAATASPEATTVRIDESAIQSSVTEKTAVQQDCYSAAQKNLSRVFNKVAEVVEPLVENGTTGSIKAHIHLYDSRFRLTLTDKKLPTVHTYVVYPKGQYGQIDATHPLAVGYKGVQKHTGEVNTVALQKDPSSGTVRLKADIGYDSYKQDLESNLATMDTSKTDCATAEKFPAGAAGTVIEDATLVEFDGVYPSLVLMRP